MASRQDTNIFSRSLGKMFAMIKNSEAPKERRPDDSDQKFDDILDQVGKVLSSATSVTPLPWISPAADAVVKVLEFVQVRYAVLQS